MYMYMYVHVPLLLVCVKGDFMCIVHFAGVIVQRAGFFGDGFGRVHLDNLACNGSEEMLQDCPHSAFEQVTCRDFESDVGVICPGTLHVMGGGAHRVPIRIPKC